MPAFERDGIVFRYRDLGEGMPLVFQHGLGGNLAAHDHLAAPGIRLLGLACRGHDGTPAGDPDELTFATYADDLAALLDRLGIETAVIGGVSMGAGVSLAFAPRHPQRLRGLILVRPAWLDEPLPANLRHYPTVARYLREHGRERGRVLFAASDELRRVAAESVYAADSLLAQFDRPDAEANAVVLERLPRDAPNRDRSQWGKIAVPTLVIGTERDEVHPYAFAETLAAAIPGAVLRDVVSKTDDADRYEAEARDTVIGWVRDRFGTGEGRA